MKIPVVRNVLEANDRIARQNKDLFDQSGVLVINLMSSPGSGKTSLLERSIEALRDELAIGVIEGDIQSSQDAERIAKKGVAVVQINTDGACHLDANMVWGTLDRFELRSLDLLVVENVGNLVCPAEFQVGEDMKAMILSVAEGDDKPSKYPLMFRESEVLLINKIDLLPHVDCSLEKMVTDSRRINAGLHIFEVSCKTGQGLDGWYGWLREKVKEKKGKGRRLDKVLRQKAEGGREKK